MIGNEPATTCHLFKAEPAGLITNEVIERMNMSGTPIANRITTNKSLDSGFEENRRRYNDNYLSARRSPPHNRGPTIREHRDGTSSTFKTLEKEYHPSAHSRGNCASPIREISSRSNQSPATAPNSKEKRTSTSSRLSDPRAGNVSGEDRVSAKESLSVNTQRTNRAGVEPLRNEPESPEIPQDLAPQNMELAPPPRFSDPITRPSNSNIFETGRLEPNERSPIRTLSEDRIHVSLRLGPLLSDTTDETEESGELPVHPALSSKAAGKREVRKQKGHSPLQGTKNQDETVLKLFRKTNLTNHFTVPLVGLAGGLSLSWRDNIQVDILYSSSNIIDTRIEAYGTSCF
ncbi:unnamed protein product, partial [Brassica oleracea var. botrytis]